MDKIKMEEILRFIRSLYPNENPVPLHAPRFLGNEKKYLAECVDSTYVSYVGKFVAEFEEHAKSVTRTAYAVAMVNGTAALQMCFLALGIKPGDMVITQALTFAATAAAIRHVGAEPAFVDVDRDTLGMSPEALTSFLERRSKAGLGGLVDRESGRRIAAIVPMHTFGLPARIAEIAAIADRFGLILIEDAAESIGSSVGNYPTGSFGRAAILSFNGNKTVTTGGGGMVITNDHAMAERVRHLSTTAKLPHRWDFFHDEVGYNFRMPNVNAAIGCAQMEQLNQTLANKRETAILYRDYFEALGIRFIWERSGATANYWLNTIELEDQTARDAFLAFTNDNGVQTRPVWTLMNKLPPYANCPHGSLESAEWLENRIVNVPSSVRL